jgi:hypothetical protein
MYSAKLISGSSIMSATNSGVTWRPIDIAGKPDTGSIDILRHLLESEGGKSTSFRDSSASDPDLTDSTTEIYLSIRNMFDFGVRGATLNALVRGVRAHLEPAHQR